MVRHQLLPFDQFGSTKSNLLSSSDHHWLLTPTSTTLTASARIQTHHLLSYQRLSFRKTSCNSPAQCFAISYNIVFHITLGPYQSRSMHLQLHHFKRSSMSSTWPSGCMPLRCPASTSTSTLLHILPYSQFTCFRFLLFHAAVFASISYSTVLKKAPSFEPFFT